MTTDCPSCIATSCPGCDCPACVLGPPPVDVVHAPDGSVIPMDHGFNLWTGFYNTAWAPLALGLAGVYAVAAIGGAIQRSQRRAGGGRTDAVDAAVLAHRANPTQANHDRLMAAMRASNDRFMREQTVEFMQRTTKRRAGGGMAEEFGRQFGPREHATIQLSASGARILKMLGPRPWEGGGATWSGNRASVDKHSIQPMLVQSGPGVGFPAGDRKRIVAAAGQLGIHPDDRGRYRAEQFRAGGGYVAFTRPRDGKERIIGPFRTPALAERERAAWAGSVSDYGPYRHLRIIPSGPEARRLLAEQSARARELAHHHAR